VENRKLHLGIPSHLLCWRVGVERTMLELLARADPPLLSLPPCSFFYFSLYFLPLPLRRGPGNTKMIQIPPLPSNSRSVGIGRWICNHICRGLQSTPLLFNHLLDPWPSSLLHISEFLPICSLLGYLALLSPLLCDKDHTLHL